MRTYKKRRYYEIVKYDPEFRNDQGHYMKDEWTSISDVGKIYDGKLFTIEEYEHIENLYIQAVFLILEFFHTRSIKITHIYKSKNSRARTSKEKKLIACMDMFATGDVIRVNNKELITNLIKLRLREHAPELEVIVDRKSRSELVFGYDYYMYLKTNIDVSSVLEEIDTFGLFTSI